MKGEWVGGYIRTQITSAVRKRYSRITTSALKYLVTFFGEEN